jgi:hypothetical protein
VRGLKLICLENKGADIIKGFMFRIKISFFLVCAFIITTSVFVHSQIDSESDTVVINSISLKSEAGESEVEIVDYKTVSEWAYHLNLKLVPDAPPFVDGKGFLLSGHQTIILVTGYKKNLIYTIYFDFMRYSQNAPPFNSKLKIFIRDIYGNKRQVGTADITYMTDEKKFEVPVPFDLSYPGRFDIIIHEYAGTAGNWGIWDIIVTSKKLNEIELMPIDSESKIKEIEPKIFK